MTSTQFPPATPGCFFQTLLCIPWEINQILMEINQKTWIFPGCLSVRAAQHLLEMGSLCVPCVFTPAGKDLRGALGSTFQIKLFFPEPCLLPLHSLTPNTQAQMVGKAQTSCDQQRVLEILGTGVILGTFGAGTTQSGLIHLY